MIIRTFILTLLLLTSLLAFPQSENTYKFEDRITKDDKEKFQDLDLIDKDEQVIAYYGIDTEQSNEAGFMRLEWFTLLTDKRIINYNQVGSRITNEQAFFNDILTIRTSDESNYLDIWMLDSIQYNPKYAENHLHFSSVFISGVYQKNSDGTKFFNLLSEQWKQSENFERYRTIYDEFFNENGQYIPRYSDSLRYNMTMELQSKFDSISISNTFEYGNLYHFKNDLIYEFKYDVNEELFDVLKLKIDNSQKSANNMDMVLFYKAEIEDQKTLPQEFRGVKFLDKTELSLKTIDEVLEFITK